MANVKITDLTEDTTPAGGDWIETVDISAGSSKKVTRANFLANISTATTAIANPYKFRVYRNTSAQTAATGFVKAQFNAESYDTNNNFDSSTNYRYTAPVSGFYLFSATVQLTTSTNDDHSIALYKNGSIIANGVFLHSATGFTKVDVTVTDLVQLTASDYVEVFVYTSNVGGQNVNNGAEVSYFSGYLVSTT